MTGTPFDALHGLMYSKLRVDLQEHMHMVGHDFHLEDLEGHLVRRVSGNLLQTGIDAVDKHLAAVLGAPDHMVLAAVDDVIVALVFHADIMPPAGS